MVVRCCPRQLFFSTFQQAGILFLLFYLVCFLAFLVANVGQVGIYTRLWCVYEAYLGTQYKKTCIMPARPSLGLLGLDNGIEVWP